MFAHTEPNYSLNSRNFEKMNLNDYNIFNCQLENDNYEVKGKRKYRNYFSADEDQKLKELVLQYGEHSWNLVSSLMKTRTQRQCRERWKHYLSCDNQGTSLPWSKEEEEILINKYNELGAKWTKIARELPGRSDLQVKNRYMSYLKNKRSRSSIGSENIDKSERNDVSLSKEEIKTCSHSQPNDKLLENNIQEQKQFSFNAESIPSMTNNCIDFDNNNIGFGLAFDPLPSNMISELCQDDQNFLFDNDFLNWSFE